MSEQLVQTQKSQRCTVPIGSISITVFQLPDGSYRQSPPEVSGVIDKPARSIFAFLRSKQLKGRLGEDSKFSLFEKVAVEGSQKPIAPVPIEMALLYWYKWAQQGNKKALALVIALAKRSIYDAADEALGVKRSAGDREHILSEDLSEHGVARIDSMRQSLEGQMFDLESETPSEREILELKIRLAELELERERLRHAQEHNLFPAKDIDKMGAAPWKVVPWTQKTLGWSDASATSRLLCRLGYGFKGGSWFKVKITGDVWVLPWPSFDALTKAVQKFKSESN